MASPLALAHTMHAQAVQHSQAAPSGRPAAPMRASSSRRAGAGCMQRAGRRAAVVAAAAAAGIEPIGGVRPEIDVAVQGALDRCLTETDLGMGKKYRVRAGPWAVQRHAAWSVGSARPAAAALCLASPLALACSPPAVMCACRRPWLAQGKVRDTYDLGDKLVLVTTDRQSAFDRLLAAIPFKGQVLNQTSAWWMQQTQHIVDNALLAGEGRELGADEARGGAGVSVTDARHGSVQRVAVAALASHAVRVQPHLTHLDALHITLPHTSCSARRQRVHHAQVPRIPRRVCVPRLHDRLHRHLAVDALQGGGDSFGQVPLRLLTRWLLCTGKA